MVPWGEKIERRGEREERRETLKVGHRGISIGTHSTIRAGKIAHSSPLVSKRLNIGAISNRSIT